MRYCDIHGRAFVPSHATGKMPNGARRMSGPSWEDFPMQKYNDVLAIAKAYGCDSAMRLIIEPCDLCGETSVDANSSNERIRQRRSDFPAMYEMYFSGKSFAAVAKAFGLSSQRVHEMIKKSGLPLREGYGIRKETLHGYDFINPYGEPCHVTNLRQFCHDNNLNYNCMSMVSRGERNHHKQWRRA